MEGQKSVFKIALLALGGAVTSSHYVISSHRLTSKVTGLTFQAYSAQAATGVRFPLQSQCDDVAHRALLCCLGEPGSQRKARCDVISGGLVPEQRTLRTEGTSHACNCGLMHLS